MPTNYKLFYKWLCHIARSKNTYNMQGKIFFRNNLFFNFRSPATNINKTFAESDCSSLQLLSRVHYIKKFCLSSG